MYTAFLTGFFLGISLIVAIGAQNAFVLRQGILQKHVFKVALFCAISDSILICIGITGISFIAGNFITEHSKLIFGISSLWLFTYGIFRLVSAIKNQYKINEVNNEASNFKSVLTIVTLFTFFNPHVYLDTMILIGSVSQQFKGIYVIYYAIGACFASFIWFFGISYGARILNPLMQKTRSWQIFDILIAIIMFVISFNLASAGNWL
jgi:L-lysine exporter family protein LysE/ArgO